MTSADVHIRVDALTMAYGLSVIQRDLSFDIRRELSVFSLRAGFRSSSRSAYFFSPVI